jgi:hypothetical protein
MNTIVKIIVSLVVLAIIGFGIYFFGFRESDDTGNEQGASANLEGNVALVNGKAIPKSVFDSGFANALASFTSQGVDVQNPENLSQIRTQVLNDLINNELLVQGVAASGIKANAEEVDREIQAILDQAGSQEAFEKQLADAGLTEDKLRENISNQLVTQAYLLQSVDVDSVTVTDEEVRKFYDDSKVQQPDLPPFEEVKDQARQQLLLSRQQALVNQFIESLRAKAIIETVSQ